MDKLSLPLILELVTERLKDIIHQDYHWPVVPKGWQIEFIAYPDGLVVMDVLHPVSGVWLSEEREDGMLEQPIKNDGNPLTAKVLQKAGIPFMTTFTTAAVSDSSSGKHLSVVKE